MISWLRLRLWLLLRTSAAFSKAARKQSMSNKAKRAQVPAGVISGKSAGPKASPTPAATSASPESEMMTTPLQAGNPSVNEMATAAQTVVTNQPAPGCVTGDSWIKRTAIAAAGAAVGAAAVVAYQKFAPKFMGQAAAE